MFDSFIHLADEALTAIALVLTIGEKLKPLGRGLLSVFKKLTTRYLIITFLKKPWCCGAVV
jgi:hypothetical protein